MTSTGTHTPSNNEIIAKLKHETESHVAELKSANAWGQFEKLYEALGTVEQVAGVRKTSLEELFGLSGASAPSPSLKPAGQESELSLGESLEPETVAEIEKGA
jgi:hypothetical protein